MHEEFSEKLLPHRSVHPSISTSLSFLAMASSSSVVTAATTLSLSEAEQVLTDQGFDVPHDLGGLRIEEIQEVLAPFGVLVPADLALLHRRGQTCLKKRDSRFLDPSNVLPPKLQRPDGASFAAPVSASVRAACSPSQPMQSARAPPSERGVQIASALVREVVVDKWSLLYSELSALPPSQQSQWQGSLAASLSNQFEFGTLSAALRSFRRLVHWLAEQTLPLECPDPSTLRAFLDLQRERGPTVPAAVLRQFLWFETQLRVPFHARSPLLADFLTQKAAPLPTQAEILTPAAWNHLLSLCSTSNSGWNGLQVAAALVIRYVISGLRFKHTQRAAFAPDLSTGRTLVWKVSKGKDGQPFAVSLPTHISPKWPLLGRLNDELERVVGDVPTFMPDCYFNSAGEVRVASVPCPYYRFQAFFRSLLTLPPLALSADEASNFSTYSMRRFLPSMADSLQLSDSERNCLGNWQDGARLPLNVRYSAERLETAAGVRRLCLAAIAHLLKHVTNPPTWLRLRGVLPHVQSLRQIVASSESWGPGTEAVPRPEEEPRSPTERMSSSSESSSSQPSSDESCHVLDIPQSVEDLIFVRPQHGMWHVTAERYSLTPSCCAKSFRPKGVRWAHGHTAALENPGRFCSLCLARLPESMRVDISAGQI